MAARPHRIIADATITMMATRIRLDPAIIARFLSRSAPGRMNQPPAQTMTNPATRYAYQ